MRLIIVTGTNTAVGKTIATAALATCALAARRTVAVVKPVQSGVEPTEPGDLQDVARLSGATDLHEYARFGEPLAPGTAARRLGVAGPDVAEMAAHIRALRDRDLVLVEGAGGPLVELNAARQTLVDLACDLDRDVGVEVLLVASAALGVLNVAALTARALRSAGLALTGVVVGDWPDSPDLANRCNAIDLPHYTSAHLSGVIASGAGSLDRARFAHVAAASLTSRFGGSFDAEAFVRTAAPPTLFQEVRP